MATAPAPKGSATPQCVEVGKHIVGIKENLLKPAPATAPCIPEPADFWKIKHFTSESETIILSGVPPSSGEIPAAIADEQVQMGNLQLKNEEKENVKILLCGALDAQDAYTALNYCVALMLQSEANDLPKLMVDLSKITAESGKEFPVIAEKIKKAYDQICIVKTAFNAMKLCIDKVCNADEKKKLVEELKMIPVIEDAINVLVKQGEQAVMSVVQAASIFALNNVSGLEVLVKNIKPLADQFKKDVDSQVEAASKRAVDWHKKYAEATTASVIAKAEYGKAGNVKRGKEAAYCLMNSTKAEMKSKKEDLLKLLNKN